MINWQSKIEVKKGNLGESIVRKYLEYKGWVVYGTETRGKHAFDKLCVKNKKDIVIVEIKSKARMKYYEATGCNYQNYIEYKYIVEKYKINVFMFFVDELLKKIYGNNLSKLEKAYYEPKDKRKYPYIIDSKNSKIILFPLAKMINIKNLNDEEVEELKKLSTRNYNYIK